MSICVTTLDTNTLAANLNAIGDALFTWDIRLDAWTWHFIPDGLAGFVDMTVVTNNGALNRIIDQNDVAIRLDTLSEHLRKKVPFHCEYRLVGKAGERRWFEEVATTEFDNAGRPLILRGVIRDITHRKQSDTNLNRLANYDDLTGIYNRFRLKEMLQHAMLFTQRYAMEGAFMLVGIDKLSLLNEAFGYQTGDAIVTNLSKRLSHCLRASDVMGRVEGDRLGLILQQCNRAEAEQAAARFLEAVSDAAVETPTGPLHTTISIGIVMFPECAKDASDCMNYAEVALYKAKQSGRNCSVMYSFSEAQSKERQQLMTIGEEIRRAIRNDALCLAYQPLYARDDHSIKGYEALLRLRRDNGSIMAAGEFITVAEELGLIKQLDFAVMELVVKELINAPDITMAFNVSGLTAGDPRWYDTLRPLIQGKPELAQRMIVEITETVAIDCSRETVQFVRALRDLGCHVAIDDFGAGHTSFKQLSALPVDYMKIDGAFVRSLNENPVNRLFIKTLLELARGLNLTTVAEGIETEEHLKWLEDEGVDLLQGYYFAKPTLEKPWLNKN
jgi:diguanylate cyclase (GGDEF)-like protein